MSEEVNKEFDEMLDDVMGGEPGMADHSPDAEDGEDKSLEAKENAAPETEEKFEPFGDEEYAFADDSAQDEGKEEKSEGTPEKTDSEPEEKETAPDAEKVALQEEITNYKKRLHDTQTAMHKANEERAKLQKELDALKNKKADTSDSGDDDNWFKDDPGTADTKAAELESKIEALEEKQEQYQQEQAVNQWKIEAEKFAASHEDFNTLVYEKLEPMLDETTGDPAVLAAYMRWQDKTPAGAYEFAQKFFGIEEKLAVPSAKNDEEAKPAVDPTKGKAGLDRINSAEFSEPKRQHSNMIDEVFG
jgi:DNA repair exonuclease SbcCD ATPase subunit